MNKPERFSDAESVNGIVELPLSDGCVRFVPEKLDLPLDGSPSDWPAPQPLPSNLPPVYPFEMDLLPETLCPWVRDVAERMQCAPDIVAITLMVTAGSVLGRKIAVRPKQHDDWQEVPNLWAMVIGRPGLLKTPAIAQGLVPLNHLDSVVTRKYETEITVHRVDAMLAAERVRLSKGKVAEAIKQGHEAAARLEAENAINDEPKSPNRRRYKVNDPTVEKLAELLRENPNGLLLHRDELMGFLKSMDKEGREDSRAFFLESWNGTGDFTSDRIGRGTIRVEALIISILGAIQPGPLSSYLRQAVRSGVGDDGLVQRFQLSIYPDVSSKWENVDRKPDETAKSEVISVFEYLDTVTPALLGADLSERIPFLRFAPDAQNMFYEWQRDLEIRLRSDQDHPVLQAHLAKYRKLVPCLALILHLANRQTGAITSTALQKSLRWSTYLESHAQRIYASVRRPDEAAARELATHLEGGDLDSPFSVREVYRKGWTGLDGKEEVEAAIEILCELNWIRPRPPEPVSNGRPSGPTYEINPLLKKLEQGATDKSAKTSA